MNETAKTLETETCSRCGGTGKFSYCQMYGDKCFKCHGKGQVLTARGTAASLFLTALREVPASTIQVGDLVQMPAGPFNSAYFFKVTDIGTYETKDLVTGKVTVCLMLNGKGVHGTTGLGSPSEGKVRKGFSKEEKAAQFQKALEYQATLTKAGKPRVR